ncbi:hypothetical protein P43SY_010049 [Pythium insidiosum]|uniref:Rab-GAP TBC domain-containing protein n=1 Tax=Pythium insidiosum TaxID=114742 RepID=A0AAD5M3W1_PYTIN|nr:hypothetical protein P43SY_010049 [Pythium insidiosum]
MEGVVLVRWRRSKLLHSWQKRYVVLSADGVLREYAEATAATQIAGSGMTLRQEIDVRGARVTALPFPLAGRPYAFRIKKKRALRVTMAAKSSEQLQQWIAALRVACATRDGDASSDGDSDSDDGSGSRHARRQRRTRSPVVSAPRRSLRLSQLRPTELPSVLPRSSEQEFLDTHVQRREELALVARVTEWHSHRLRSTADCTLGGVAIQAGAMVVAINGLSLQTLSQDEVAALLRPGRSPSVTLRWLKSPFKRGVLKCKLCYGLTTQLKTIAMYRNGLRAWKKQFVELDGDVLTCQTASSKEGRDATRSVIPLVGGTTVKAVHELIADQKFCFLVSVKAYTMLFQAASEDDMATWIDALERAINIAEGCIPGADLSFDALQLESSINMRVRAGGVDVFEERSRRADEDSASSTAEEESAGESDSDDDADVVDASTADTGSISEPISVDQLTEMLQFLQSRGRFVEALQLMESQSSLRAGYWGAIFRWAFDEFDEEALQRMLRQPLHPADLIQVQKDVPRTSKWLAGSAGAPQLTEEATQTRLKTLETVLHAFLASCSSDTRTDAVSEAAQETSFYMQGMNGIAFIILEVVGDDVLLGLRILRGIVSHILPHVFGIRTQEAGGDNFDLFSSLVEVGSVLEEVVQLHLPAFHDAMDAAGLPVCLLAYKWFPTLFSDISIMAHRSQLRFETLLAIWDICLLLGVEGMFCVALALFSAAEEEVTSLRPGASTELVTGTLIAVLSTIEPRDLVISVCEVLELCSHPVLLKLRNGHRRRLRLGVPSCPEASATATAASSEAPSPRETKMPTARAQPSATGSSMTVRDLDSGKLFAISKTGNMLLPVKPSL